MSGKFKVGDRVVHYGRLGRVEGNAWRRGVYWVDFDDGKSDRVFESELSLVEEDEPDRLWRNDPVDEAQIELPEKDPYSTGLDIDKQTASLVRERLRYHAAHLAMETFREERDFLLEKLRAARQWMDYEDFSDFLACENKCTGCRTEMIEASNILKEALSRQYTNDPATHTK